MSESVRKKGPYPSQRRDAQAARRQHAQELYESGLSLRQIAVRMNITYQAVHALLRRAGVPLRIRGGNQGAHSRHKG
jgi:DNA invertase Pin-like site-specific DNA recombinase